MDREGHQVVCNRSKAEQKLLPFLALCLAVALCGASATDAAAASRAAWHPASGNMILVEEKGSGMMPGGQSAGRMPDTKGDATRTNPSAREDVVPDHPEPSWQVPAPGCPFVDRALNLIV